MSAAKRGRTDPGIVALAIFVTLLTLGSLAMMLRGKMACDRAGGVYVRGLAWMECVDVAR